MTITAHVWRAYDYDLYIRSVIELWNRNMIAEITEHDHRLYRSTRELGSKLAFSRSIIIVVIFHMRLIYGGFHIISFIRFWRILSYELGNSKKLSKHGLSSSSSYCRSSFFGNRKKTPREDKKRPLNVCQIFSSEWFTLINKHYSILLNGKTTIVNNRKVEEEVKVRN